ncbi:MAG: hypothetical protein KBD01_12260 [Acidobacteria bacterium]|nr:hypothetical protein [Acidobacteriota bacterium]
MTGDRAFVVGLGEVGRRIAHALAAASWTVTGVTRSENWPRALDGADPAPRVVCVREDDLPGALERFGDALRGRLALVQNGFLEAVVGPRGPETRALIWFTSKGDFFRVLRPSLLHGALAARLAAALARGGLPAEEIREGREFVRQMILKGIWNAVVGLPLAVHGVDLGTYMARHRGELERLVAESARAASAEYDVDVDPAEALEVIVDTTRELAQLRGGAKSLAWRNGALARFGARHGVATPVNEQLLAAAGWRRPAEERG